MPTTPRQWTHSSVRLSLVGTKVTVRAPARLRTYTSRSPSYGLLRRRLLPRWVSWDSEQTHSNFSAVSLLHNVNIATHVDRYNQPGSTNVLVPLSSFRRGELWLQEEHGPDLSPKGQHQGRNHPLRLPGLEFDPLTKHATCPWKDDRLVLSAYTPLRTNRLELADIDHLVSLGFNL